MKDIEEFVKTFVEISFNEDHGSFGYFPFHLLAEKKDGKIEMVSISGINNVEDCYKIMCKYIACGANRVYLAVDFPAGGDIENDFVAVFETLGDQFKIFAIPYNTKTGSVLNRINKSSRLFQIVKHLRHVAVEYWMQDQFKGN